MGRWQQVSKIDKMWNWPWCENYTDCRVFQEQYTSNAKWIPKFAKVVGPLVGILDKDFVVQWQSKEIKARAIWKEALCNALVLKTIHVSNCARKIVVGPDTLTHVWEGDLAVGIPRLKLAPVSLWKWALEQGYEKIRSGETWVSWADQGS